MPIVLPEISETHSVTILLDLTPFHDLYKINQFMLVCQNCKQNSISGKSQPRCYSILAHKMNTGYMNILKDSSPWVLEKRYYICTLCWFPEFLQILPCLLSYLQCQDKVQNYDRHPEEIYWINTWMNGASCISLTVGTPSSVSVTIS